MHSIYDEITRKLGCEPEDLTFPHDTTENDDLSTPFDALTLEEIQYLRENSFFPDGKPVLETWLENALSGTDTGSLSTDDLLDVLYAAACTIFRKTDYCRARQCVFQQADILTLMENIAAGKDDDAWEGTGLGAYEFLEGRYNRVKDMEPGPVARACLLLVQAGLLSVSCASCPTEDLLQELGQCGTMDTAHGLFRDTEDILTGLEFSFPSPELYKQVLERAFHGKIPEDAREKLLTPAASSHL